MSNFKAKETKVYEFMCIPPAFIKLVLIIGAILFVTTPVAGFYILLNAPWLKMPAIIALVVFGVSLFVLKQKWRDYYKLQITSSGLKLVINNKPQALELAYAQIKCFSMSPFVDGEGNEVSKLTLIDSNSKTIFSIKILNQSEHVWAFLNAWQETFSVNMTIHYKNGVLHAVEQFGEFLGGFDKSTNISKINFCNPMYAS